MIVNTAISILSSLALGAVAILVARYSGRWRRAVSGVLILVGFLLLLPQELADITSRDAPVPLIMSSTIAGVVFAMTGAYTLLATDTEGDSS